MFNNHELYKYGFLSCANCIHKKGDSDCKRGYRTCSFEPVNWNLYIQVVLNNLKLSNIPATKTDKLIRKAFKEEIPNTTKIIIAQRVSSVEDADKIIVMDNGRINGFGTHKELLENNKIYREVYESQTKGGEE